MEVLGLSLFWLLNYHKQCLCLILFLYLICWGSLQIRDIWLNELIYISKCLKFSVMWSPCNWKAKNYISLNTLSHPYMEFKFYFSNYNLTSMYSLYSSRLRSIIFILWYFHWYLNIKHCWPFFFFKMFINFMPIHHFIK